MILTSDIRGSFVKKSTDIRKACNNCIKAKAACDHNRPCFRCLTHKIADSCANVPRKHNLSKRRRIALGLEDEPANSPHNGADNHNNVNSPSPHHDPHNNLLNDNLSHILSNLNNASPSQINGEINNAIHNLNNSSSATSAMVNNAIHNLNSYNLLNAPISSGSVGSSADLDIDFVVPDNSIF